MDNLTSFFIDFFIILWNIVNTNLISSFLGGVFAGFYLWRNLQGKIENAAKFTENKRTSIQFLLSLMHNRVVAEKFLKDEIIYRTTNKFTFLKYKTKGFEEFIKTEPLELDRKFYIQASVLDPAGFEKDNMLIDIYWFSPQPTDEDRQNYKITLIENAKNNIKNIDNILNNPQFNSEMQKLGLAESI